MYVQWSKNDIKESKKRLHRLYINALVDYRFICEHDIQSEDDEDSLDYYMLGAWLALHRNYD